MEKRFNFEIVIWLVGIFVIISLSGISPYPNDVAKAIKSAKSALQSGMADKAAEQLAYISIRMPWRMSLWDITGRTAFQGNKYELALKYLRAAQAANQLSFEGAIALGQTYRSLGDSENAIVVLKSLVDNGDVRDLDALLTVHTHLLEIYQDQDNFSAAVNTLQKIVELQPLNPQLNYQLGLMMAAQEPEAALGYLVQAMEIDQNLTDAVQLLENNIRIASDTGNSSYSLFNAGRALAFLDEWELAKKAFSRAVELNPDYSDAWAFLGEALQQIGQDGSQALATAYEKAPDSLAINILYALYYQRQAKYEQALDFLYAADTIEPENPAVQAEIANVLFQTADVEGALYYYRQAVAYTPQDPTYLYLLARFSIYNNLQIRSIGLPAARQALILNEDDPIAMDLMGYGYYLLDDFLTAERFLFRALEKNSSYAPAHLHFGLLQLAQENYSLAKEYFSNAENLAPGSTTADQASRILQRYWP